MKNRCIHFFMLCSISWSAICSANQSDTIEVKTKISAVSVFFEGARITRTGSTRLNPGSHIVSISGLPIDVNPKSVRIKSPEGLKILSVSTRLQKASRSETEGKTRALEQAKKTIESEIEWLKAKKVVFTAEERVLMDNTEIEKSPSGEHSQDLENTANFYRKRLTELYKLNFENTVKIRELQDSIQNINLRLNRLKSGSQNSFLEILLLVEARTLITKPIDIEYFATSAGWEPLYDFRFEGVNQPLRLIYNANVYQSTGEDWKDVKLSLVEGTPGYRSTPPEFQRWYITKNEKRHASPSGISTQGSGTLKGTIRDAETSEPLPFVNIVLSQNNQQVAGAASDFDGNFTIKPLKAGVYEVLVNYVGYTPTKIESLIIRDEKINFLDIELKSSVVLQEFQVIEYSVPLKDKDGGSSGGAVRRDDIHRMPGRSARDLRAGSVGGIVDRGNMAIREELFFDDAPAISSPKISYQIDRPSTVLSNQEDRIFTVKTEEVNVEFLYRAIPKVDTDVYLLARITDWGNLQLLSGKSTIYFQGAYTGESLLEAHSVKDTLEIDLGKDDQILLERKLNQEYSSEKTFGSKVKKEVFWEITARNNKSHPILLELIDQVPLSHRSSVEVELISSDGAKTDKKSGKLTWELTLPGNSSEKVQFGYELKYPGSALIYQ